MDIRNFFGSSIQWAKKRDLIFKFEKQNAGDYQT